MGMQDYLNTQKPTNVIYQSSSLPEKKIIIIKSIDAEKHLAKFNIHSWL